MEAAAGNPTEAQPSAPVFVWQVVAPGGLAVRTRAEPTSVVLAIKAHGTIVRGCQQGSWVQLVDEPGYLLIEGEDGPVLRKAATPLEALAAPGSGGGSAEGAEEGGEGAAGGDVANAPPGAAEAAPAAPLPPAFSCFSCGAGFAQAGQLEAHLGDPAVPCAGQAWQAAVSAMACLPGAGTTLWCPACSSSGAGRWSGPATKAAALLRHAGAAGRPGERRASAHERLLRALLALLLADLPASLESDALQEWAAASRLLQVAGPLLAAPSAAARRAVRRLEEEALGGPASGDEGSDEGADASPPPDSTAGAKARDGQGKKRKRGGGGAAAGEGPSYDFYNADIPLDVFQNVEDHTVRTADGVPVLDLLSSDEEGAAAPKVPATAKAGDSGQWL